MPYNTAAIPPRRDVTGSSQLPLTRVKKIIGLDPDIAICSNNAAFVIALATEMFIQTLSEQGHNSVKAERKPRKNVQYKDLASAVARVDNLEFLSDIVPRTITYGALKAGRANGKPSAKNSGVETGQTTLDQGRSNGVNGGNRLSGASILSPRGEPDEDSPAGSGKRAKQSETRDDTEDEDDNGADPNAQLEMEIRGAKNSQRGTDSRMSNGEGNSRLEEDRDGDVNMS